VLASAAGLADPLMDPIDSPREMESRMYETTADDRRSPGAIDHRSSPGAIDDRRARSAVASPARAGGPPATLLEVLDASVAAWPERPALQSDERTLTYAQLAEAIEDVARRLRRAGVGRGDRVGVRLPSGKAELYVAILGILRTGAAYVPVDADDPAQRARQIFRDAAVCAVLGPGLRPDWLGPTAGQLGGDQEPTPDDDAWVIFTSGSTGEPKGVAVSHRAATAFVNAERRLFDVHETDRVMAGLSVAFDASCEEMWLAWANGAALVPAPRELVRAGHELGPWLRSQRVTVVSTVPALAAIWERESLAGVRLLILGGEALPEQLAWRLASEREVWNTYGPTEATVVSTAARVRPGEPVTIGRPLEGWEVAVVDERGEPVEAGETGELVIAGVGLGRYLDPELDRRRYAPLPALGWQRAYRTGDLVADTPAGLRFVARRDGQVKIAGRRIELGEIDAQLSAVAGVRAAATVVRETAAGNRLLVAYVSGEARAEDIRSALLRRLPAELVPRIVPMAELPVTTSGKLDRRALPWPPPPEGPPASAGGPLTEAERWLADRFAEQLGPVQIAPDSDFFALGGSSLAAARLASSLRARYPSVAVADVYNHRTLRALATRLEQLGGEQAEERSPSAGSPGRRAAVQLAGVLALLALASPTWVLAVLTIDRLAPGHIGPQVGWGWLIAGWLAFASAPGRGLVVAACRRLLLADLRPGRHPRNGWLSLRLWFVQRVADGLRYDRLAGTPWSWRFARLCGHRVGPGARLGTLPPVTGLVSIGEGATIEGGVDMYGWWIDGPELVIGEVTIGPGARIGTRAVLMPGARVGAGAEVEPGAVVCEEIGAGERWAGSPAQRVGRAGDEWPSHPAPEPRGRLRWLAMYAGGLLACDLLSLLSAIPALAIVLMVEPAHWDTTAAALRLAAWLPVLALSFVLCEALLVAAPVRLAGRLIEPGLQGAWGATAWALWFCEELLGASRTTLFSLYATVYTRPWLRLAGVDVGRRAEVSTATGLSRLSRFEPTSFAADDVAFAHALSRDGWLRVEPICIGPESFVGNGAILPAGTRVGGGSLVGLLTTPPRDGGDDTAWLGSPALELPRRRVAADVRLTTEPSRARLTARAATEAVRILLPATVSAALILALFYLLEAAGADGVAVMALVAPLGLAAIGVAATAFTVAAKWAIIGRYRRGEHPLWSFFVWRDEIINSLQEQLAGPMLIDDALGTPLMSLYLRAMGSRVGRDAWIDTLTVTEFDMVHIGDGAVANRHSVIETHLFHDRVLQIGPGRLGAGATLGPYSTMLPDTVLGDGCSVGARSIVMRGERLPARTRWHGAPVIAR